MTWNLPNILTVLRLAAAPLLGLAYVLFERPQADMIAVVLFIGAALTDYLDGWMARSWGQESRFGAMLDPIADKAMVVIALALLIGLSGLNPWILVPAMLILTREIFVSGLREFLGADAKLLQVTKLAKWKTTFQMFAVAALLFASLFEAMHEGLFMVTAPSEYEAIMAGLAEDPQGIASSAQARDGFYWGGVILLWLAGLLTCITGYDYFRKAMPFLGDAKERKT